MPSCAKRSCQRQTAVLDMPASRMIRMGAQTIGAQQHYASAPDMLLQRIPVSREGFKPEAIRDRKREEIPLRIPLDSQDTAQTVTPDRLKRQSSATEP